MDVFEFIAILPNRYAALFIENANRGYGPERNIRFTLLTMNLFDPKDFQETWEKIRGLLKRAQH